jgi:hypothetical protein
MFDLRYHVASLAAVFLALLIGILVGVGISGKADEAQKNELRRQVARLEDQLATVGERRANLLREQRAAQAFAENAYPLLIEDRLKDKRIAVLFVGSIERDLRLQIERALDEAGARVPVRLRALKLPIDVGNLDGALAGSPALAPYRGDGELRELGRLLGTELVEGGDMPAWDALSAHLVEEQAGDSRRPADGVVVTRTVGPQAGDTARFLAGLYEGLADRGVPAVGVESSSENPSAIEAYDRAGLSSVDDIDRPAGLLALALLLSDGEEGHYGLKETAEDGILPPIEPLPAEAGG